MNAKHSPYLVAIMLAVAACRPGVAEYTDSESPKQLILDSVASTVDLRFMPGSYRLAPGAVEKLRQLAASGAISPSDQVRLSVSGPPELAQARQSAIDSELLRYGIVTSPLPLQLAPDQAVISVGRTLVTLPPCPNWSSPAHSEFGNAVASNFGCATAVDLGRMVAIPADLASGRPLGRADGVTAISAVQRYYNDKVVLPTAAIIGPIAAPSSATPGSGGQGGAAGGGGGAAGSQ